MTDDELNTAIAKELNKDVAVLQQHDWEKTEDGEIDTDAMDGDMHNGPMCARCGYAFCIHCEGEGGYTAKVCKNQIDNYCNNANQTRLLEDEIEKRNLSIAYVNVLAQILKFEYGHISAWFFIRTTPRQRCEAALRVLQDN